MGLSLICSKDDEAQNKNTQFMDECVDVLRSYGRVGMLMLESASIDCEKCEEYLSLAEESFSSSMQLWSRIGLSHLTKFKQGLELEEILDDLWDFWMDRVRTLQLLTQRPDYSPGDSRDMVSSLHELKMLAPYKPSYASSLLDLMTSVSDEYRRATLHDLQVSFAEEALRIDNSDSKVLLLMNKLYVDNKQFEKAHRLLQLLFEQDSFDDSLAGARTFAEGFSFSDKGLDIYRELASNYGDADFAINVDIACNLAFVEGKRHESIEELKRIGSSLLEAESSGQLVDSKHIQRIRQTIFDALQEALNSNQHEDCLKWADAALTTVSSARDRAMYMRVMSRSCVQLGRNAEALDWAEKALAIEPSKQSQLAVFQVAIEAITEVSEEKLTHILEQLKARDDFEIDDLLAMGKLANNLGSSRQDIVMLILDELCHTVMETDDSFTAKMPVGVLLQNAAQLAFTKFTQQQQVGSSDNAEGSYGEKFLTYANVLLLKSRSDTVDYDESFVGPPSIFEWFFRMSFDIAKSTEDSRYFMMAANIAERSDKLYGETSPLTQQSQRLQLLIQEGSPDSSKLCYLLRRLITLAESKTKAQEWFEHVLQLIDNLDVAFPELEMECAVKTPLKLSSL
ncbi:uncharacterized protein PITG_03758 [Phytophthora infestans T30-4]|uniref:Uncharacterized protein n=1 Tax=Phytophthora infestans (strain T30-4) TaxID=403677 RepID=D0MYF7_PHYIT|nr:uncharacterized protein PITG_03758 [Phytophthora infestans T30-4]EEY66205.1 hypothetical protein PITG_03758 [Phytophthora infestans T30-4]|eukprot:XP_002906804.1 hypothetical protein PITG_03758 [Phytophthora infestans T30-4]